MSHQEIDECLNLLHKAEDSRTTGEKIIDILSKPWPNKELSDFYDNIIFPTIAIILDICLLFFICGWRPL